MTIPTDKRIVVALGGNAISNPGLQGTIDEQFSQTRKTTQQLAKVITQGYQLVITHGNGPQVGNVLRRVEIARSELYPLPLEVCVADTQAGMGYMIGQCLMNDLAALGQPAVSTTIVTSVLVDRSDPAFADPSKPIGPRFPQAIAEAYSREDDWHIREMADGKYRRVVPSPKPIEILELDTITSLVAAGQTIICCGGGGIPVCRDEAGDFHGAAAVVDKDRTTALLATRLGVSSMVILTAVEKVCLNFGMPDQEQLDEMTVADAEKHMADNQFRSGSMRPKVEAAVEFVRSSAVDNPQVVIGHVDKFAEILAGKSGTRITR